MKKHINKEKRNIIVGSILGVFLIGTIICFLRGSYAKYEVVKDFSLIEGQVPSFIKIESISGNIIENLPTIASTDEAVCGDNGVVQVSHAGVTGTTNDTEFQKTEYRYCGSNPNNYVTFNGETAGWRIIGLVNTPEGQRIKLIRAESIGTYSWDNKATGTGSSTSDYGSNDWSDSALQEVLNNGVYYNRTSGVCPSEKNGATVACDFSTNGLTEEAKSMIDTVTWNLGGTESYTTAENGLASHWYSYERGTTVYSGRPTTWNEGTIALMYPSDYGYATGGGSITNRSSCLAKELYNWDGVSECYQNDWLYLDTIQWTLSPRSSYSYAVFSVHNNGDAYDYYTDYADAVRPVLYLKPNVIITGGTGDKNSPYELCFPDSNIGDSNIGDGDIGDGDMIVRSCLIEGSGDGDMDIDW